MTQARPAGSQPGWWVLALLFLFGILCVTSTYTRLSETDDELYHISCGMEWWEHGTYTMQALHPPLARVMDAAFVELAVALSPNNAPWHDVAPRDAYMDKMLLTRLGSLPFYIISCCVVFLWSRNLFGRPAALWSLGIYVTLSSVTAHAALATTDMGYTAMLLWALFAFVNWLKKPGWENSVIMGASIGLMIGTKFSGIVQWPAAVLCILIAQLFVNDAKSQPLIPIRKIHLIQCITYTVPVIFYMLAIVFRFSITPLLNGLHEAARLSSIGFGVWFYGPLNNNGVWYFFPVVFFFKTPLSLFFAALAGNARMMADWKKTASLEGLFPLLAAIAIMLVSMTSNINLGVRHVMPLYPLLSISGGYGLWWLWQKRGWKRAVAGLAITAQVIGFIASHPEHIAYFNILAGTYPEHITLDSDYDWGQEMIALDDVLLSRNVQRAYMCARKDTYWNAGIVVHSKILSCPQGPVTGWIAVARAFRLLQPKNFTWLNRYEAVEKVGDTMDLYYIPEK